MISKHTDMNNSHFKYNYRTRRMSWNPLTSRDLERERLEGSLLTVCSDCKDMVVQVNKSYNICIADILI